jgi:CMP-N-acetylneuraminic acid synthetase
MKGHSERVPDKNFRRLGGKPLFRWVLDTLLSLPEVDRVVINTDARGRLADLGLREDRRVVVRDRKPELCGDLVSMNRVLADDLAAVEAERYLMTHATNPFLSPGTIRRALEALAARRDADSLFSVNRVQTRFYRADGSAVNHDPQDLVRTQDLEPWFEENSCLYLFTRSSFAATGARIGVRPVLFEMPRHEALDIDTMDDWRLAEALVAGRVAQGGTTPA